MKIAVSSTGPSFDDMVETRFGRCAYFLIVDLDTMELEALPNPNKTTNGGTGIQLAQLLARKNVSVLLTNNCVPSAIQTFSDAGIPVMTGLSGQVRQAVHKYISWGQDNATAHRNSKFYMRKFPHSRISNGDHQS